jgi:hypothetical protein
METANGKLQVPELLRAEHHELHEMLARATKEPGALGAAAKRVADLMHPHFVKEELFALPPLSLLPRLARGELTADMKDVLLLTERLERELPRMLEEHKAIVDALGQLLSAARAADRLEYAEFALELIRHAQTEEQLLYPAAIVAGRYIRARLNIGRALTA